MRLYCRHFICIPELQIGIASMTITAEIIFLQSKNCTVKLYDHFVDKDMMYHLAEFMKKVMTTFLIIHIRRHYRVISLMSNSNYYDYLNIICN